MEGDPVSARVFGPVPSRRLGRSLGIDLVPFKYCTYDCIYCQLGHTTDRGVAPRDFFPVADILAQARDRLAAGPRPDYITLSGSGEPTLHSGLEQVIAGLKDLTDIPLAVLTNGSLLWRPEVRRALGRADLVMPSLDAADQDQFIRVNQPHPTLTFDQVVQGLLAFRRQYRGRLWLEVFLLQGETDDEAAARRLAQWVEKIGPDRVQVNTVTRPPASDDARTVEPDRLARLAPLLGDNVEVIASRQEPTAEAAFSARREDVLALLQRRPCSLEDISAGLALHRNEVLKYVEQLLAEGLAVTKEQQGVTYYVASDDQRR